MSRRRGGDRRDTDKIVSRVGDEQSGNLDLVVEYV